MEPAAKPARTMPATHPAMIVATVCGVGLLPGAPGTWGSLAAAIIAWFVAPGLGIAGLILLAAFLFVLGCWVADAAARASLRTDPGFVVVDEVVGQFLVLALSPHTVLGFGAGFILFRFFDIVKPWPIKALEKQRHPGFGIMIDDVGAAVYAGFALYLGRKLLG